MTQMSVSVVIVSRRRPDALRRCLTALRHQTYRPFEVVVVGDTDPKIASVKYVSFDTPNISAARNLGIGHAAGTLIAFIDDDAVAEPTWLARLVAAMTDPNVASAGGFVRGRNGISFQWKAERICSDGMSEPMDITDTAIFAGDANAGPKLQGTNCMFRADVLRELGGFDEAYLFFLDEADLCLRLAKAGYRTAVVPGAEVQHGYEASTFRGKDRRPKTLFQIGASHAYFIKQHGTSADLEPFRKQQIARLHEALIDGLLEPRDVRRLSDELEDGFLEGSLRLPVQMPNHFTPLPFLTYDVHDAVDEHRFILSRMYNQRKVMAEVDSAVPTTVIALSATSLFHRRYFHADGYWVQSGGIFGKSARSDPLFRWYSRQERVARERSNIQKTR